MAQSDKTFASHEVPWPKIVIVLLVIVEGIVIYSVAFNGSELPFAEQPAMARSLDTWQQYGISIQYPAGVSPTYHGSVSPSSGNIDWYWNGFNNELELIYNFNITQNIDFNQYFSDKRTVFANWGGIRNATEIDRGNIVLNGLNWSYATYEYNYTPIDYAPEYHTVAMYQYPNDHLYRIDICDISPDTQRLLQYYAGNFTGY